MCRGYRCRICTGCGLCPGVKRTEEREFHILAEEKNFCQAGGFHPAACFPKDTCLIAVDLGTTTIAMVLYGQDGLVKDRFLMLNPQTEYGRDVISRIQASEDRASAENMRQQVLKVLEQGIERFSRHVGTKGALQMVLSANTTMIYLLMGYPAAELGRAPFHASFLDMITTEIAGIPCMLVPGMSAFVGGDILAGMEACGLPYREELTLLIDLGTNGEMVLGDKEGFIACATAAGPAFEGGANRGIWGTDMVSVLAALKKQGLVDEEGLLAEPYFSAGIRVGNVPVTREAIRSLQLAKGAIATGIEILMEKMERKKQIQRVVLAGGFGYYLNPADAAEIGLLPKDLVEKTVAGGNTALLGSYLLGKRLITEGGNNRLREDLDGVRSKGICINLAEEPDFEKRYMNHLRLI